MTTKEYARDLQTAWRLNRWQASAFSKMTTPNDWAKSEPKLAEPIKVLAGQGLAALQTLTHQKAKAINRIVDAVAVYNPELELYGSTNGYDPKR